MWILYEQMREAYDISEDLVLTCLTQDIMHFVPLRILKAMRRILGAISKVSNRLGWMLPDVFLYVRISKNLGAEYGRGKSRGVLSLLGAEGKFYESN